jgi:hypothetical protein
MWLAAAVAGGAIGLGQILTVMGPIVIAGIGGFFGYRQAVKIADRTANVEGRKLDISGYESLVVRLEKEIENVRADRDEDEARFEKRIAELNTHIQAFEEQRRLDRVRQAELEGSLMRMVVWARGVTAIFRRGDVAKMLVENDIYVPEPPAGVEETSPGRIRIVHPRGD